MKNIFNLPLVLNSGVLGNLVLEEYEVASKEYYHYSHDAAVCGKHTARLIIKAQDWKGFDAERLLRHAEERYRILSTQALNILKSGKPILEKAFSQFFPDGPYFSEPHFYSCLTLSHIKIFEGDRDELIFETNKDLVCFDLNVQIDSANTLVAAWFDG